MRIRRAETLKHEDLKSKISLIKCLYSGRKGCDFLADWGHSVRNGYDSLADWGHSVRKGYDFLANCGQIGNWQLAIGKLPIAILPTYFLSDDHMNRNSFLYARIYTE